MARKRELKMEAGELVIGCGGRKLGTKQSDVAVLVQVNGGLAPRWANGSPVESLSSAGPATLVPWGYELRPAPASATGPSLPQRARLPYGIWATADMLYLHNRNYCPIWRRPIAGGPAVAADAASWVEGLTHEAFLFSDANPPWDNNKAGRLSLAYCEHVIREFCAGRPVFERKLISGTWVHPDPALSI